MLKPRTDKPGHPEWMSTWQFLQRCGLVSKTEQKYAYALEDMKMLLAKDCHALTQDDLKTKFDFKNADAIVLDAVISNKSTYVDVLNGFLLPKQPRVESEFVAAYPNHDFLARKFSTKCCDKYGNSLVSLTMIYDHLRRHADTPKDAIDTIEAELTQV